MALWEYKVISSGKGGFATPALLESFLNQLGGEDWEIIEFRTLPDNPLAFSGLARRPTQRDWTLEAAAAAAAKAEADKLRAEFAAKFQAATGSAVEGAGKDADNGMPNRDDTYRRPRDTEHDQDPYALDDSAGDDQEDIPDEDVLPTFFEAVRPHMRRNQKGPGYSVGVDYLLKKFEMIEDDLVAALKDIGFVLPDDEDDKPVYVEYDGDIYWLNTNRRGEVWLNTREKPRPVFKVVKANRLSPEEEGTVEQAAEAGSEQPTNQQQSGRNQQQQRRQERQERQQEARQRRQEQAAAQQHAPAAAPQGEATATGEATGAEGAPASETASGEGQVPEQAGTPVVEGVEGQGAREANAGHEHAANLPEGLGLLDRLRPMMRRSRGGWSGTISYLSRALRTQDAALVESLAKLGLVPPATSGEKAPVVESGPFSYWLNKDGRGGIWINVRESKRMRHEERGGKPEAGAAASSEPSLAEGTNPVEATVAPVAEISASVDAAVAPAAELTPAPAASVETVAGVAPAPDVSPAPAVVEPSAPVVVEAAPVETVSTPAPLGAEPTAALVPTPAAADVEQEPTRVSKPVAQEAQSELPLAVDAPETQPLASVRQLLKEGRAGTYTGELCALADQLARNPEEFLGVLAATGLKVPEKPREKVLYVSHAGELFWLTRNAKGELWLNAKAAKAAKRDEEDEDEDEGSDEETAASGEEKKPRRSPRGRKKSSSEETSS